jgi:SAM-dependent methyltransferase
MMPLEFFVLEVGCNKGHNLDAMASAFSQDFNIDMAIPTHDVYKGVEINKSLCNRYDIINGSAYELPWSNNVFDLVFSSGVLIHIPPNRLKEAMNQMRTISRKWVMMIEYPADKETGTKYGTDFNFREGVWSRPYGKIYQDHFKDDKLISTGSISDLGEDGWGFSKCDYWIFEKHGK